MASDDRLAKFALIQYRSWQGWGMRLVAHLMGAGTAAAAEKERVQSSGHFVRSSHGYVPS